MEDLKLTLAVTPWEYLRPLLDGEVQAEGIDLTVIPVESPSEIFRRMLRFEEFDVSEISFSSYLRARLAGRAFIAIPVFPSRKFRHSFVFVNQEAGIERPEDLRGKRVGLPGYQMTLAVWVRGFLMHDYGLDPPDMKWFTEREEVTDFSGYPGLSLERIPSDKELNQMLIHHELDALMTTQPSLELKRSERVRRLFPDFRRVEMDYFRRTGFFPIMHTVALKQKIYENHPWIATRLMDLFEQAKRIYLDHRDRRAARFSFVWTEAYLEEEAAVFGRDPWPFGLAKNRRTVEALVEYAFEQGLIQRRLSMDELFAANTLGS